jgi:hypothetical protein
MDRTWLTVKWSCWLTVGIAFLFLGENSVLALQRLDHKPSREASKYQPTTNSRVAQAEYRNHDVDVSRFRSVPARALRFGIISNSRFLVSPPKTKRLTN